MGVALPCRIRVPDMLPDLYLEVRNGKKSRKTNAIRYLSTRKIISVYIGVVSSFSSG